MIAVQWSHTFHTCFILSSVMIVVDACVILSNAHLWHPAVGLSYWLELEMINGLTMQGVGSERSWSFQVELSLLYFCENFSHCFSTALSHHFAPPQTHTHMYTHMVQFSAIEHISCVSYCAEVCAHIFQHQYGRKLSSLFFFPLVNLNNATLQLLGGGPCRFQTLAKVDGKSHS